MGVRLAEDRFISSRALGPASFAVLVDGGDAHVLVRGCTITFTPPAAVMDQQGGGLIATAARPCRVALAGFGTVGQSVARLLQQTPEDVELVAVLNRRVAGKRVDWLDGRVRWTESIDELLAADVDVFVELIGGRDPAETWIRAGARARHLRGDGEQAGDRARGPVRCARRPRRAGASSASKARSPAACR